MVQETLTVTVGVSSDGVAFGYHGTGGDTYGSMSPSSLGGVEILQVRTLNGQIRVTTEKQTAPLDVLTEITLNIGSKVVTLPHTYTGADYIRYEGDGIDWSAEVGNDIDVDISAIVISADEMTFIDGVTDRFGKLTTQTYFNAVDNPPAIEVQSAFFDENAIDPYELANAKINII